MRTFLVLSTVFLLIVSCQSSKNYRVHEDEMLYVKAKSLTE